MQVLPCYTEWAGKTEERKDDMFITTTLNGLQKQNKKKRKKIGGERKINEIPQERCLR